MMVRLRAFLVRTEDSLLGDAIGCAALCALFYLSLFLPEVFK